MSSFLGKPRADVSILPNGW